LHRKKRRRLPVARARPALVVVARARAGCRITSGWHKRREVLARVGARVGAKVAARARAGKTRE